MNITFELVNLKHIDPIFSWLAELYIQEFWDNSQEHKDDILKFAHGRKEPSNYADGLYTYWVGLIDHKPYCLLMTIEEKKEYDLPAIKKSYLSKIGTTYSMEYMIGNKDYFGKGLGAETLGQFIDFFKASYDNYADTFFIDPDITNPRARHVYEKAGFKYIDDFIMEGDGVFKGRKTHFLVRKLAPAISLIPAALNDYTTIQNMARFYVYDRTKYMGWECPENGLFECIDFKHYFEAQDKKAFVIRIKNELAGFVLIDQEHLIEPVDWNMGEFFILAKFQNCGVGRYVAREIFASFPGKWSVAVMPENLQAVNFWRNIIAEYSAGHFTEVFKTEEELRTVSNPDPYAMIILTFNTDKQN